MPLIWAVAIGLVVGLARGGSLRQLGDLRLRALGFIPLALGIQLVIFPLGSGGPLVPVGTVPLHIASYALLVAFILLNRRYRELLVMGAGLLLNLIVIVANGGYMPASATALERAGLGEVAEALRAGTARGNTILMGEGTRLNFLGDILYLPAWVPLSSAFSIGDVVLGVGLAFLLGRRMAPGATSTRRGRGSAPERG